MKTTGTLTIAVSLNRLCRHMLAVLFLTLAGCAMAQEAGKLEHGIDVTNKGTSVISEVAVRYGPVTRTFCERGCGKGVGSYYGVHMPIQDEMFVSWKTADGKHHEVHFPVRSRIKEVKRFRRLLLRFDGGELIVHQGAYYERGALAGWDETPLYP
ncbi:MAG: hypothetical protein A2140_02765 [Candidatus Muproteobacteria bacterium RBG_16_62_13]|uniref:Lipoprotein n=1 Tax=Candidatus Muproteobacteria bacterium RBG_16_62_13 TaxID=1817756 RepID=A0A1F6T8D2_9PROT|nr:MAG: hypothetical protein A2140_02765 [Candidatus Muproteobacteria bacterium RBG_16_62_13]